MAGNNGSKPQGPKDVFLAFPELDRILRDGVKRGRAGTHAAVLRVVSLVGEAHPNFTPATVWARLRELKEPRPANSANYSVADQEDEAILRQGYAESAAGKRKAINTVLARHPDWSRRAVWQFARKLGLNSTQLGSAERATRRRWSERETERLLNRAGYDSVGTIAIALGRTPNALRCKLASLGNGSKVTDSYSRHWIANTLHVGFRRVNQLLNDNQLEMRIPLIASASLEAFVSSYAITLGLQVEPTVFTAIKKTSGRLTQERVAEMLGVSAQQVRIWVVRRWLPAIDDRITARSFERYCRTHASELNHSFMKEDERDWLAAEAGIKHWSGGSESRPARSVDKHALLVRQCPGCHRKIRGNAYFRHAKVCVKLSSSTAPKAAIKTSSRAQAA